MNEGKVMSLLSRAIRACKSVSLEIPEGKSTNRLLERSRYSRQHKLPIMSGTYTIVSYSERTISEITYSSEQLLGQRQPF